jgi:hypothetical protein
MFLTVLLVIIFVGCFASLMKSGLWSNTITLVNVITAALVATNYFEPLADFFERQEASLGYVWDFFAIWLIFVIVVSILRAATDYVSRIKVRFYVPVEQVGGLVMAIWVSWIVLCFATATLHAAPLARNFLNGAFAPTPTAKMLFGTFAPDQVWLGWAHRESKGTLSRFVKGSPFDPQGEFILKYGNRREEFEGQLGLTKRKAGGPAKGFPPPQK